MLQVDEPGGHYTEYTQPVTKGQMLLEWLHYVSTEIHRDGKQNGGYQKQRKGRIGD
jgi:hypothetical protein